MKTILTLTMGLIAMVLGVIAGCAAQSPPPVQVEAAGPAPVESNAPDAASGRWPLVVESGSDQVVMYQPQLESLVGDTLTARAAVSVQQPGQQEPTFGVVWLQSRVATDRVARTMQILDVNITKSRFPDAPAADEQALTDALRQRLAERPKIVSL